ncbi:MAG: DUF488 family protein [Deltaproteobacteria bacterium]|nr:DUF488 family protein [Deltaproteobacteria bacterium]
MIKEACQSKSKRAIRKGDLVFDVSGFGRGRQSGSSLTPSRVLLEDWKGDRIRWKEYVERYFQQLYNDQGARSLLQEIISLSMERDVWLVGLEKDYPCHRFLLKQIVEKVLYERKTIASVEDYSEQYRTFKNMTRSQIIKVKKSGSPPPIPIPCLPA